MSINSWVKGTEVDEAEEFYSRRERIIDAAMEAEGCEEEGNWS